MSYWVVTMCGNSGKVHTRQGGKTSRSFVNVVGNEVAVQVETRFDENLQEEVIDVFLSPGGTYKAYNELQKNHSMSDLKHIGSFTQADLNSMKPKEEPDVRDKTNTTN